MAELVFRGNPQLETERLILRQVTPDDAAAIFAYASDEQVPQYMIWDVHRSLEDTEKYIAFILNRYERDEAGEWGIVLKATGRLIGAVGMAGCDAKNKRAEVGYVLAQEYWGQGIMPEALGRVIDFAFAEMGLNRVESCHFLPNEKSGRVMQKAGMSFEGIVREKIFAKGRYWDVKQYAILRSDWLRRATVKQFYSGRIPTQIPGFSLRFIQKADLPLILELIRELADYEKLLDQVTATVETLQDSLYNRKTAEVILAEYQGKPAGYALFFYNFSTFLGRPGIYLEDLYVRPALRGLGMGKVMLAFLARLAVDRNCGRLEWSCLDWNEPSICFYRKLGALAMDQWTVYRMQDQALQELAAQFTGGVTGEALKL